MNQYSTFNDSYKSPYDSEKNEPNLTFDVESKESFEQILQMFPIVVVDVWAPYCNPCRMMMPKYEAVAKAFLAQHQQQQIIFMKENIEEHADIHKPNVTVVPTFFMYVHGKRYHIADFREMYVTVETALMDLAKQAPPPPRPPQVHI